MKEDSTKSLALLFIARKTRILSAKKKKIVVYSRNFSAGTADGGRRTADGRAFRSQDSGLWSRLRSDGGRQGGTADGGRRTAGRDGERRTAGRDDRRRTAGRGVGRQTSDGGHRTADRQTGNKPKKQPESFLQMANGENGIIFKNIPY